MKKSVLKTLLAMFVLSFIIAMTSCNKDTGTNATTNPIEPKTSSVIDQTVLPDGFLAYFDAHQVTVTGTLETPMQNSSPDFCSPDSGKGGPPPPPPDSGKGKGGPPPPPNNDGGCNRGVGQGTPVNNGGGFEFRGILMQLKLTKDQMPAVQKAIWAYQQCVQEVLVKSFAARKEVMYSAEQQRKSIMDAFKTALQAAGKDTALIHAARKAAMDAMNALNKDTQAKLAALIDNIALCACWTTLITDIEAGLTADQLTLFQAWLAKQKTPCDAKAS
jgi:hypothetical protein